MSERPFPPLERPTPPPHHGGFGRPVYIYEFLRLAQDLVSDAPKIMRRLSRMKDHNAATAWEIHELAERLETAAYLLRRYDYEVRSDRGV